MVHRLSSQFGLPVYGFADMNPFGLALLLTYKIGSARMGSRFSCDLKWLGLRPSQLARLSLPEEAMQDLSARDSARLDSMEKLLVASNDGGDWDPYLEEIAAMREGAVKCELEALISGAFDFASTMSPLSRFVEEGIVRGQYI